MFVFSHKVRYTARGSFVAIPISEATQKNNHPRPHDRRCRSQVREGEFWQDLRKMLTFCFELPPFIIWPERAASDWQIRPLFRYRPIPLTARSTGFHVSKYHWKYHDPTFGFQGPTFRLQGPFITVHGRGYKMENVNLDPFLRNAVDCW